MGVTGVHRDWQGETFTQGASSYASDTYVVQATADTPRLVIAAAAAGGVAIPPRGTPHPEDPSIVVREIEPKRVGPAVWRVTVDYATPDTDGGGGTGEDQAAIDNPLKRRPTVRRSSRVSYEAVNTDYFGEAVTNSAGDTPQGLQRPYYDTVLTITRNQRNASAEEAALYENTTNLNRVLGYPPGQVLCERIDIDPAFEAGFGAYWQVTWNLAVRNDAVGWDGRFVDEGFHYLDADGNRKVAVDDDGQPYTQPVLLNGSGGILEPGQPAHFITWDRFGNLDFPTDLLDPEE